MVSAARSLSATRAYLRPRSYVAVKGRDAADLLQRLLSNDVLAGESCEALILTPKGRVIAPLLVWRRADEDFLLLTEPELGETVRSHLARMRFASKCEIKIEEHSSTIVFGEATGIPTDDYGEPATEVVDAGTEAETADDELERLRILARTPRWGHEIDETILPAEAGLDERAVSFTKGCFPGQEPVARLHNRGHANRTLRVLELDGDPVPGGFEIVHEGRTVGRVTSAVPGLALGYVRVEVPAGAEVEVAGQTARIH